MIDVSIVIVCMNRPDNLRTCLSSIKKYTSVSFETFVVAYLFSEENLRIVKEEYPWVKIVESNEIRGFSENNNLALRQAAGRYCFILNDDTELRMPVIDRLVETIENLPEKVAIVSPNILKADGSVQFCGRPRQTWKTVVLKELFRVNVNKNSPYINKQGLFKTYNILGAAFLIKKEVFQADGWFDERYFFCPEDIALSTHLNEKGYECWVNSDINIIHFEGMSGKGASPIRMATLPAHRRGSLIFYSRGKWTIWLIMTIAFLIKDFMLLLVCGYKVCVKRKEIANLIFFHSQLNLLQIAFTMRTPKDIFIKYYKKAQKFV